MNKFSKDLFRKNSSLIWGAGILLAIVLLSFISVLLPETFFENDWSASLQSPSTNHILGTGSRGNDIAAGIISGLKISLTVALLSVIFATLIGLPSGLIAATFGNKGKAGIIQLIFAFVFFMLAWFYAFYLRRFEIANESSDSFSMISEILFSFFLFIIILLIGYFFSARILSPLKKFIPVQLPIDTLLSTLADIITSFPLLMIILTLTAIAKPSLWLVVVIIGCTTWTGIFRVVRSVALQTLQLDFITAAKAMGMKTRTIILKHVMSSVLPMLFVHLAFTFSAAIVLESALTFLGAGLPVGTVTLGSLLSDAKSNFTAWWLVLFPGLVLFLLLLSLQLIASGLQKKFNPRLR